MKKIYLTLILFITALVVSLTLIQPVHATESDLLEITGVGAVNTIHIDNKDGQYFIYIDGVQYDGGFGLGHLSDYIDDYGTDFVSPAIGYGIQIKGVYNQPFMITGIGTVNTIHIDNKNGQYFIYIDGLQYDGGFGSGHLSDYIDDYGTNFASPSLDYAVMMYSDKRPAISGQENFAVSVDDPKPVSYFQSFLSAYDETDGDLTSSIYLVNDNYTTNKHVKGTYEIEFAVKDAAGNISSIIVKVTVGDTTKPVISGNSSKVQISYTQTWNVQTFKTTLVASDNYDTMTNANIVLESDGYTSKKTTLGTYNVVFSLTDASGNKTTFTKQVEVIDDIAPTWTGPTSINKPNTSILTLNDIKDQLTATDEKEGNVNTSIKVLSDEYTGNGSKVGNYSIVFEASDSKGNKSTRTVVIVVQDNLPPVWYIQDGVSIKLVPPTVLTQQQIVDLIIATGQLNISSQTRVMFKVDNYTGNETVPGVYMMTLAYSDTNGNEGEHEVSITVLDTEDDEPITVDPGNDLWSGIVKVYDSVIEWVKTNPYQAAGSGLALLIVIFGGIALLGNKRRY